MKFLKKRFTSNKSRSHDSQELPIPIQREDSSSSTLIGDPPSRAKLGISVVWPLSTVDNDESSKFDVDIVFVHGLGGHPQSTWSHGSVFWPRDLLPSLVPNARILTFGYNSKLLFNTASGDIHSFAESFVAQLNAHRSGSETRPLIFIGHSMGGLVIKRAITISKNRDTESRIYNATKGVVFLATPHQGSALAASGAFFSRLFTAVVGKQCTASAEQLRRMSETLRVITSDFTPIATRMRILTFFETKPVIRFSGLVVEEASARIGHPSEIACIGLDANHKEISRFQDEHDGNFMIVSKQLEELVKSIVSESRKQMSSNPPAESRPSNTDHGPLTPKFDNLPAFATTQFFGRDVELLAIQTTFDQEREIGLCVHCLHGIGGVGKTQIALQYGFSQTDKLAYVFWLHADQEAKLMQDVDDITRSFYPDLENGADSRKLFAKLLSDNHDWLLIFDSVDSIGILRPYWPMSRHGRVLMTSRDPVVATVKLGNLVQSTQVKPFDPSTGANFIREQLQSTPQNPGSYVAEKAAKILGGLPLALCHLVGYLDATASSLEEFLELPGIRHLSFRLLDEHDAESANFNYELRFATAFDISLGIVSSQPEAIELLSLLVLLNPDGIEEALLRPAEDLKSSEHRLLECLADPVKYNRAIARLRKHSLIEKDAVTRQLKVHRLVRWAVIRQWRDDEWRDNFNKAFAIINPVFPKQEKGGSLTIGQNLQQCRRAAPHVQTLDFAYREAVEKLEDLVPFANLLANCGYYMYERGLNSAAFDILTSARSICEKELGDEPNLTHALVLNNLSNVLSSRGPEDCKKALELDIIVTSWREQLLGPNDIELGNSLFNLAISYADCNELQQAEMYYRKAEKVFDSAPETPSQELFGLLYSNMGRTYLRRKKLDEAERLLDLALHIQVNALGEFHYFTTATIYQLGNLKISQGMLLEAEKLVERCITLREQCLEPTDYRLAVAYHKLGWIRRKRNSLVESAQDLRKARKVLEDNKENTDCEPGLLVRTLLLLGGVLNDLLFPEDPEGDSSHEDIIKELQSVKEAILLKGSELGVSSLVEWASDDAMDSLVQPDFR